jgi:septation ring formation regulator EzrA
VILILRHNTVIIIIIIIIRIIMKNKINPENFEFILDYKNHIFGFSFKNNRKKIRNILLHGSKTLS